MTRPLIGISVDNVESNIASGKYESNVDYSQKVFEAGGLPVLLPQEVELAAQYVDLCDGLMLTGGNDVRSEAFGVPAHPLSCCMDARRQQFDLALLDALQQKPQRPTLGVCLGMQLMAMHAGGRMNQHLPDTLANAVEVHQDNHRHPIVIDVASSALCALSGNRATHPSIDLSRETVVSSHHQAVTNAGRLRVIATSSDGVIEAIDDPTRLFYVGVQWHPERGDGYFCFDLIKRFVDVCAQRPAYLP